MQKNLFGYNTDASYDYENGFYITSPKKRIAKLTAHYELYKSITHLPGHIVECGVYKGASLIRFASFRDMLELEDSRKIIGFDAFGSFPQQAELDDKAFIQEFEAAGGDGIDKQEMQAILEHKRISNTELVQGDITETVPNYAAAHPELRIALLHIDVDVYQPSKVILEELYDRIVPGGLLVLDDYGLVNGETRAVDEYFKGQKLTIEKLPISHVPSFIRKPL